jgi:hypothetical protein
MLISGAITTQVTITIRRPLLRSIKAIAAIMSAAPIIILIWIYMSLELVVKSLANRDSVLPYPLGGAGQPTAFQVGWLIAPT